MSQQAFLSAEELMHVEHKFESPLKNVYMKFLYTIIRTGYRFICRS